jgi:hypothetical protein
MSIPTKRSPPDISLPKESKKIYSDGDTIASLLAKIETEFQYRENTKEEALKKWEQEGKRKPTSPSPSPTQSLPSALKDYLLIVKVTA